MVAVIIAMDTISMIEDQPTEPSAWIHLWQLISPTLPIGAYAYSQGQETAVEKNWINNELDAQNWIQGILNHSLANLDAPVLARFYQAWQSHDSGQLTYWNQFLLASRESSELYAEDQQMGQALWRLLNDLLATTHEGNEIPAQNSTFLQYKKLIEHIDSPSYSLVFALAVVVWKIPLQEAIRGFLWAWCENQVAASIKLIPLGQTAGQRILNHLIPVINQTTARALAMSEIEIGAMAPGFSIVCAQHEVQYSRLFRS